MNCYGCKCNYCLYNCELESWYLTPGEVGNVEDICYFCDECRGFDGDYRKRSNYRTECSRQRFPKKYLAQEELIAQRRRRRLVVIKCAKSCGNVEVSHETTNIKPIE